MRPQAFLLDALGTLVELLTPAPRLARALARRGIDVGAVDAERAMRAEIAYYRAHHDEASDLLALADLRWRCAGVVAQELELGGAVEQVHDAVLEAIRFRAAPEARDVLVALRAQGSVLAVVSNWDVSLHGVLADVGLAPLLDVVITSAEARVAKPDPAIFERALAALGVQAQHALHVGDSIETDVRGAHAAGVTAVLLAPGLSHGDPPPPGLTVISSLSGLLTEAADLPTLPGP